MALALSALAAHGESWLRLDVASGAGTLWVDLDGRRIWLAGVCDGGRPIEALIVDGDRIEIHFTELLQADLGRGQLAVEQRSVVRVRGDSATLSWFSAATSDTLEVPLRAERTQRRSAPSCGTSG